MAPDERSVRLAGVRLPATFVLAVGNLHPRKNIARLVRAVAAARDTGAADLHLVLAGQRGWDTTDVDAAIEAVGGRRWVHELGYVPTDMLRALYGEARAVAYVSRYEGFGLPALEALACGAVVVASDATALPEVVGEAAVLVDPLDHASIERGMLQAVTDETERARVRAAAAAQVARFSWERCAQATVAAYRLALG
jgi:glycosyltransferase involved in cell wall biosynthesis